MKAIKYYIYPSFIPKHLFKCLLLVISTFPLLRCTEFVEIEMPSDQIVSSDVFNNEKSAVSAVTGLYSQATSSPFFFMNGALTFYPGLSADEILNTTPNPNLDQFAVNAIAVNHLFVQNNIWRYGYSSIYHANACIEGLSSASDIPETLKNQLVGEMLFIRAFSHFYLLNLFGDVPLITTTDYVENSVMPRISSEEVYSQIINDLLESQKLLTEDYPVNQPIRPNIWVATSLLARVYLYSGEWQKAEMESSQVINSNIYQLLPDLNEVFLVGSKEAIWQLASSSPFFNTTEGFNFIPASNLIRPTYRIAESLLKAFDTDDKRKEQWLQYNEIDGDTYFYPFKYKVRFGEIKLEHNTVLRLAEQYLIRAEARAHMGDIQGAINDINNIRQRAGLDPFTENLSLEETLLLIENERQMELFSEWGHRWFDLKRTGRIDNLLGPIKNGWIPEAALYPIPLAEIERNPFLIQNPGY